MFSRGEKLGISGLVFLILGIYLLPFLREHWFPPPLPDLSYADSIWIRQQLELAKGDSSAIAKAEAPDYFDPNTADVPTLLALGFTKHVADNLVRYRSKGGRMRKPDDLLRIWGMDTSLYRELADRIRIVGANNPAEGSRNAQAENPPGEFNRGPDYPSQKPTARLPLDINAADSIAWVALPGIGPATARRILSFREKLGGFVSERQLMEVYGIDTQRIRNLLEDGRLQMEKGVYRRIPLARATLELLDAHPYISRNQAKVLIAYRQQHNGIRGEAEFRQIAAFSRQEANRILPYLDFGKGQ
jgi:DNA uptake protein ComE-like DNA-binding protein